MSKASFTRRLRRFQKKARSAISGDCISHLQSNPTYERVCILAAPTGSGKTYMTAATIRVINDHMQGKVAFLWLTLSKGGLVDQARDSLKDLLRGCSLKIQDIDTAARSCPESLAGTLTVIGWEKLNKEDSKTGEAINIHMKDSDLASFPSMCTKTREAGIPIVLIIDESHYTAPSKKSKQIRNDLIKPAYTLEVSATPKNSESVHYVHQITYREVADEGMIKRAIVKKEFSTHKDGIRFAAKELQSRIELAHTTTDAFEPKMLVYISNTSEGDQQRQDILPILKDEFGWSVESGDVVFELSNEKTDKSLEYRKNKSKVKVIITKTAVDTGVDIPSIQVIVQFRNSNDVIVQVQKVGRGTRMPEQKHYGNDLDVLSFYVFSGCELQWENAAFLEAAFRHTLQVKPEFLDSVNDFNATRSISTGYTKRDFDTNVDPDFGEKFHALFLEKLTKHDGLLPFNRDKTYTEGRTQRALDIDRKAEGEVIESDKHIATSEDIDIIFNTQYKRELKHLWRHYGFIKKTISDFFDAKSTEEAYAYGLNNKDSIVPRIKETVKELNEGTIRRDTIPFSYRIPNSSDLSTYEVAGEVSDIAFKKSLYTKYVVDRASQKNDWEKTFETQLDKTQGVKWWARNYDRQYGNSFSVVYETDESEAKNFFVDYGVMLDNGVFLLLDTKGNDEHGKEKKEKLFECVKDLDRVYGGFLKLEGKDFYIEYNGGDKIEAFDEFVARLVKGE